ncbi:Mo-dependent nitrogenase C-terminal domain-containing protein [Trichothermofontia sichuanensis B231]|uniref:Mo-dependent nitrogenase C-terminal domain-containing protein n=1 Tax=Trichothermofontia sichuanensis TaxID=3045816 RepID=UPI0022486A5D|nr:Mo-dependent nitrogenase C-terminal domain-containing protein [Trichothermofontia sichuanensis]UZQ54283.1 Mo-dependent nitrogenase C-terminal domain-containing protein [Trichothermofontia sichuanensis B231]
MSTLTPPVHSRSGPRIDLLNPLRNWLDHLEVRDRTFAHLTCRLIPCCCPFERDLSLFGHTLHIPALCKLNPVYDQLVSLRFRALAYLTDVCGEDVTRYIC